MKNQYIGVTGFMSREEVGQVLGQLPEGFDKKLMVGMLVSGKTIYGMQNKFPKRYPLPEDAETIFVEDSRVLNLVHYNTKKDFADDIANEMRLIESVAGKNCHGFQLNLVWPIPRAILKWKNIRPNQDDEGVVVLQCGAKALALLDDSPAKVIEKLKIYEGLIDHVLLDPSGGTGKSLDPECMLNYLDALYGSRLEMSFGVAGGFAPSTLDTLLLPIAKEFPQISIDAEGRLRTPQDDMDIPLVVEYIHNSYNILKY